MIAGFSAIETFTYFKMTLISMYHAFVYSAILVETMSKMNDYLIDASFGKIKFSRFCPLEANGCIWTFPNISFRLLSKRKYETLFNLSNYYSVCLIEIYVVYKLSSCKYAPKSFGLETLLPCAFGLCAPDGITWITLFCERRIARPVDSSPECQ